MGVSNPPSPLSHIEVTDTADIVLADIAASYNNLGANFVLNIPKSGFVLAMLTGRLQNDAGGGSVVTHLGVRVAGVNYWFSESSVVDAGVGPAIKRFAVLQTSGSSVNDYNEMKGVGLSPQNGGLAFGLSVEAAGMPPGAQVAQVIVARSAVACSLRGVTTPSRATLLLFGR